MSLDGTAVQKMKDLFSTPFTTNTAPGGNTALPSGWSIVKNHRPSVSPLAIHTLTGLADFVAAGVDGLPEKFQLHVADERSVSLYGPIAAAEGEYARQCYAVARADGAAFQFGQMIDHERFVIGLQTSFLPTPERDELLALVSKISEREVRESNDDGIGQEVTVSRGVTTVGRVKLPNPVKLAPFRTFLEVEQPDSLFVLRARGGGDMPQIGLFEADGAAWKLEAIKRVATWLRGSAALKGVPVIA